MKDATDILSTIERCGDHRAEQLLPLVYDELRKLAAQKLAQEKPGQTLQATALVHEAYLRLVGSGETRRWSSRGHFFAAAAEAMRRILVEHARRRQSLKRGEAGSGSSSSRSRSSPRVFPTDSWSWTRPSASSPPPIRSPRNWSSSGISPGSRSSRRRRCWRSRRGRPTRSGRMPGRGCSRNSGATVRPGADAEAGAGTGRIGTIMYDPGGYEPDAPASACPPPTSPTRQRVHARPLRARRASECMPAPYEPDAPASAWRNVFYDRSPIRRTNEQRERDEWAGTRSISASRWPTF